jgi:hypothetical protein
MTQFDEKYEEVMEREALAQLSKHVHADELKEFTKVVKALAKKYTSKEIISSIHHVISDKKTKIEVAVLTSNELQKLEVALQFVGVVLVQKIQSKPMIMTMINTFVNNILN